MPVDQKESVGRKLIGDFAPKSAEFTDEVLFGDLWARAELSPWDRSLITVAEFPSSLWAATPSSSRST
jgi:4-carboxymuconolactone decarboxylase